MKATFRIDRPDQMEATMEITMSVGYWRELKRQIADAHPGWNVIAAISDLIQAAEQHFEYQKEEEE